LVQPEFFFRPSRLRGSRPSLIGYDMIVLLPEKHRFGATSGGALGTFDLEPTVETVGYCRSSLTGLSGTES
jgi:hypothetical protein